MKVIIVRKGNSLTHSLQSLEITCSPRLLRWIWLLFGYAQIKIHPVFSAPAWAPEEGAQCFSAVPCPGAHPCTKVLPLGRGLDAHQRTTEPSSAEGEGFAVGMSAQSLLLLLTLNVGHLPRDRSPCNLEELLEQLCKSRGATKYPISHFLLKYCKCVTVLMSKLRPSLGKELG